MTRDDAVLYDSESGEVFIIDRQPPTLTADEARAALAPFMLDADPDRTVEPVLVSVAG